MKYVIYTPGMPFNGETFTSDTETLGGSETMGYLVARGLAERGHMVMVFCNTPDGQVTSQGGVTYIPIGRPSETAPCGENFEQFISTVPHDVFICQRNPGIFSKKINSKVNLFWCHDLFISQGSAEIMNALSNVDRLLTVSSFHTKQAKKVISVNDESIDELENAIDLGLIIQTKNSFSEPGEYPVKKINSKTLVYTHRPERGLIYLVRPGGIMEQLLKIDPEIRLVCSSYDIKPNNPEMLEFYSYIDQCIQKLPNVVSFGSLSKKKLYEVMAGAWLHVYPSVFSETSCITAMEQQALGTPILCSNVGAIPDTVKGGGAIVIDNVSVPQDQQPPHIPIVGLEKDVMPNEKAFVDAIIALRDDNNSWHKLHKQSLQNAKKFSYADTITKLEGIVDSVFNSVDKRTTAYHYLETSDILACKDLISKKNFPEDDRDRISAYIEEHYGRMLGGGDREHYEVTHDFNEDKGNDHMLGHDEYQLAMPRIKILVQFLANLPKGSKVLDYGCCVGQVTSAYARKFPDVEFTGVDISQQNVDKANSHVEERDTKNVKFVQSNSPEEFFTYNVKETGENYDAVICSEVMEHVVDYRGFVQSLENCVRHSGDVVITVPSGPVEKEAWVATPNEPRGHVHHFEPSDLQDIFGKKTDLDIFYSHHKFYNIDCIGNFVIKYKNTGVPTGKINYNRKHKEQNPRQTLSVCMISKTDGDTLAKTLKAVEPFANEIIIGFDGKRGEGKGWEIAEDFGAITFEAESPLNIGFAEARNRTIERASSDWIMWIDDDENITYPENIDYFLRNNTYNAYAVHQHHFISDPPSVQQSDIPTRIFRNHIGIKFFGTVHEHPELSLNEGIGPCLMIPSELFSICHSGYLTEKIRRQRFVRNWPLIQRDQVEYPERRLAKFLYIRDLAHMNSYEIEQNRIDPVAINKRAKVGVNMFRDMVDKKYVRECIESLPYVTVLTKQLCRNNGYEFEFSYLANNEGNGDQIGKARPKLFSGSLPTPEDADKLVNLLISEKNKSITSKF